MNNNIPGAELTREPFRWDQRLFGLVLRLTGTPPLESVPMGFVPRDGSPIDAICEATGGRSYAITSHRMLMQCVDSLVQKIQSGVVMYFEKIGPDPPLLTEGLVFL
jgi:integrator complex subunit 6